MEFLKWIPRPYTRKSIDIDMLNATAMSFDCVVASKTPSTL